MKFRIGSKVRIDHERHGVAEVVIEGIDEDRSTGAELIDFKIDGEDTWGYAKDITRVIAY